MFYFAKPSWTQFLLIEFPLPNKSSSTGKVSCDTITSHYLDEITICINLISASKKERKAWTSFSLSIYLLSNSWKRTGGASWCKYQNACKWHLFPAVPHSKPVMAIKEISGVCIWLPTKEMLNRKMGATATDQGAHMSGDSKSCSCGDPHAAFTSTDVQRRPVKYEEIFLYTT